jgi:HSP20 family protein
MNMDLIRHRPGQTLRDLSTELNRLLEAPWFDGIRDASMVDTSQWVPAVDIREESERFVVEADVPGVKPEDIEITMENGTLSIRGERRYEKESGSGGARRIERAHGMFYRRFALPDTADPDKVKARGDNGVLVIEIGKREGARARLIPVEH